GAFPHPERQQRMDVGRGPALGGQDDPRRAAQRPVRGAGPQGGRARRGRGDEDLRLPAGTRPRHARGQRDGQAARGGGRSRGPVAIAMADVPAPVPRPPDPEIEVAEKLAHWMDRRYLDPLLGFVLPGIGDLISAALGVYPVLLAWRRRAPKSLLARMLL